MLELQKKPGFALFNYVLALYFVLYEVITKNDYE